MTGSDDLRGAAGFGESGYGLGGGGDDRAFRPAPIDQRAGHMRELGDDAAAQHVEAAAYRIGAADGHAGAASTGKREHVRAGRSYP